VEKKAFGNSRCTGRAPEWNASFHTRISGDLVLSRDAIDSEAFKY